MKDIIIIIYIIAVSLWIICNLKKVSSSKMKTYIILIGGLITFWMIIRLIKWNINIDKLGRILWYLYYLPMLFLSTLFLYVCLWNNKNEKLVKIFKKISIIGSLILFLLVLTNDIHNFAFKFEENMVMWSSNYKYGVVYFCCFAWIFTNFIFGIINIISTDKIYGKKYKIIFLGTLLILALSYSICYALKIPIIFLTDLSLIDGLFIMIGIEIVIFNENYKQSIQEALYSEIQNSIKDKTILIKKIVGNIKKSKNPKKDLAYIKMLVSYCKRKSNLIIIEKNQEEYTSSQLNGFIKESIVDVSNIGINGDVVVKDNFVASINTISTIYEYIYNIFEYCYNYSSTNVFINISKEKNNIILRAIIDSKEKFKDFKLSNEVLNSLHNNKIEEEHILDKNAISLYYKIPSDYKIKSKEKLSTDEINELIHIKSRVHDVLGQRLSIVHQLLENENNIKNINEITPLLKNILEDLNDNQKEKPYKMLEDLQKTYELVGTNLYIVGNLPKDYMKAMLLIKIIRECSTNSIRHGKAKNIYVKIIKTNKTEMIISDDGISNRKFIEGDGIKGMRSRVTEYNGKITITAFPQFIVDVCI